MRYQVVLAGAGHAHLYVAAQAERLARAGIGVVLVEPRVFWYSGLATGMLAGQYDPRLDRIHPARLVKRRGGVFLRDRLTGIDPGRRTAHLASGRTLPYDALSLNLGSATDRRGIPGAAAQAWAVKPVANLWRLRRELERRFARARGSLQRAVVVGGGPTGCEVAACLDSLARRRGGALETTLVTGTDRLLAGMPRGASRAMARALGKKGVRVRCPARVEGIEPGAVILAGGERLQAGIIVAATGLRAPATVAGLGLSRDGGKGVRVRASLQSVDQERVFAVGDCASLAGHRLPNLGVFGVRQAPILLHNLAALLEGRPLRPYRPQKRWLAVLNLGDGRGLAVYGRLHWLGRMAFRLKDHLDRRFLARYRE